MRGRVRQRGLHGGYQRRGRDDVNGNLGWERAHRGRGWVGRGASATPVTDDNHQFTALWNRKHDREPELDSFHAPAGGQ